MLQETERLQLDQFYESDWPQLYDLDNDPFVMAHINGGAYTSITFIKENIIPLFTNYDGNFREFGFWKVQSREGQRFLGWVCLRPTEESKQARLGYRFTRDSWGQGFATEAATAMVNIGFKQCMLQSIVATTYEANLRSRRVLEKLGFRFLRDLPVDFSNAETTSEDPAIRWDGVDKQYFLDSRTWESTVS